MRLSRQTEIFQARTDQAKKHARNSIQNTRIK
jgi:hypothetical protein